MSREKMPLRKDGPNGKPRVLDLWCTVFWPSEKVPELAACAEVFWASDVYAARLDASRRTPAELV